MCLKFIPLIIIYWFVTQSLFVNLLVLLVSVAIVADYETHNLQCVFGPYNGLCTLVLNWR